MSRKFNKYDYAVIVLILSTALGLISLAGGVTLCRVLAILYLPMFLGNFHRTASYQSKNIVAIFVFLLIWMTVSWYWTMDRSQGIKELVYYPIHMILFLEIYTFFKLGNRPLNAVIAGWVYAVLVSGTIGCWELITDHHLSVSVQQSGRIENTGTELYQMIFASSTFGNYNTFVTFLGMALPFVCGGIIYNTRFTLLKVLSIVALVQSVVIILFNSSRGGLLVMSIVIFVFLVQSSKLKGGKKIALGILLILITGLIFYGQTMLYNLMMRFQGVELMEDSNRMGIYACAFKALKDSFYLGTGVGSMAEALESQGSEFLANHNLFMEFLMQYGVIAFIAFFAIFIILILNLRHTKGDCRFIVMSALISLPVLAVINSTYLLMQFVWVYLGCLYAVSCYRGKL